MQVVSGPMGKEKVHYQAPSSDRIENEMEKFLYWFENEDNLDLVLKASIAHFWFVSIHPFEDGNGRITRAITDMMLLVAGTKCKDILQYVCPDTNLRENSITKNLKKHKKAQQILQNGFYVFTMFDKCINSMKKRNQKYV